MKARTEVGEVNAAEGAAAGAFSLRRRLLIWMAVPLLVFVLFDAWLGYRSALQTTQSAYDRLLVTAAHALGDMIRLERAVFDRRARRCARAAGAQPSFVPREFSER